MRDAVSGRRGLLLAALAGAVTATGQAPLNFWPMAIAGFAALGFAVSRETPRRAGLLGWAFGAGYFALALSWIVEPFLVDIGRHGWMAPFALILMAGGLALFWGGAAWLSRWIAPGRWSLVALPAALIGVEALRGWIFTGFPWALIGHALIDSPFLPLAALGGPHLLSLALLAPAMLLALARPLPAAGALVLLAALGLAAPAVRPQPPATTAEAPVIRLVQPNAAQRDKWRPEMVNVFFHRQLDYSAAAPRPDLIVWPETAVPWLLNDGTDLTAILAEAAQGVPLALGIRRTEGARIYNSLAVIAPDGSVTDTYDKHHLVPFGEYIPLGDLAARVGISAFAASDGNGFSAGPGAQLIDLPGIGRALPLICYEAVFPRDIRAAPERPDFLLQVTNDGWFGRISGPYQHFAQARLRAVEQGLPIIRVANTGVSGVVAADGSITATLPLNQQGYLDAALPPAAAPTPYSRTGDLPMLLLVLAALLALGLRHLRRGAGQRT